MKISLNWLREYVDYDGTPDALAELLTMAGVEVEGIETRGANFAKVVVAQVLSREQHPNADRLGVCTVDDGTHANPPRQIVCGATNFKVGDKVPLALPGATLPGDVTIKVGKLRGVESEGMLCSAKELRLADDAAGLLILPADAPVGAPIGSLFPSDTIFDLEITPNRSDLLSHVGLAREVAALSGKTLRHPWTPWKPPWAATRRRTCRSSSPPMPGRRAHFTRRVFWTACVSAPAPSGCAPSWKRSACARSTTWST